MKTFAKILGWVGFGATAVSHYLPGRWGGIVSIIGAVAGGAGVHAAAKTSD